MNKITEQIWIGNSGDASSQDSLRNAGITAILNCAIDLPPTLGWREGFKHYHVGLMDGPGNSRLVYQAASSILYHLMENDVTLVHCHEGRSRSAFIAAMAMASKLHEGNLSMIPAMIETIKAARPIVSIHPAHMELFEFNWKNRQSTC